MILSPETTLRELVDAHPYLLDWLAEYRPGFRKLRNPMMRKTIGSIATLDTIANMGDVPLRTLVNDIEGEIARRESSETGAEEGPAEKTGRERRRQVLEELIGELHDGAPVERVKERFSALVREVDSTEIAEMEQALIAGGLPVEEVQRMCDVHVEVFREGLEQTAPADQPLPKGHPIDSFRRENREIGTILKDLGCSAEELAGGKLESDAQRGTVTKVARDLARLADVELHYLRKENQLFPVLERHGVTGPTQVMWGIHDEIREALRSTRMAAEGSEADRVLERLPDLLGKVEDMVYKEEKILFPVALEHLSEEEWAVIHAGEPAIGYAWIEPPAESEGPALLDSPPEGPEMVRQQPPHAEEVLFLQTGALTAEQVDLMLTHLPFDLTFVDERDEVRFYSEGERVFPRSPAVIGRKVHNCHPPKSVEVVVRILDALRAGEKDGAEFWIEHQDRFVHIRYIAVRDRDGTYRGVLEVVQDATAVRGLTGEKRLLDWE